MCDIYMTSLVMTWVSSLLPAFSDELGFIVDNKTNVLVFPFSDDLFSSLIVRLGVHKGMEWNEIE